MNNTKEYSQKYYSKFREKLKAYNRKWMKDNISKIRTEILVLLGNKCCRCGFSDIRILQIDHVNNSGGKERERFKGKLQYYKYILDKVKNGSKDYQILCPNCNWLKRFDK